MPLVGAITYIRSPVEMALMVTDAIVVRCKRKQISTKDPRALCFAIGATATCRPEYTTLIQKSKNRCNALRPLLSCDTLETMLCGIEELGKQSLQDLSTQHELVVNPQCDTDSLRTDIVDHITSGGCEASHVRLG